MRRFFFALAMAVATATPVASLADDPAAAQQIAQSLRASGKLKGYSIGVKYNEGVATLEGRVTSVQQMAAALAVARQQPGVTQVVNKMKVGQPSQVRQAAANMPTGIPVGTPVGASVQQGPPQAMRMPAGRQVPRPIAPAQRVAMNGGPEYVDAGAASQGPTEYVGGGTPLAMAGHAAGGMGHAHYDAPHMPNYAWPSYAAYPNYAAVTYPRQYSPTAWPYIGPFYPYPQVPLGWRKVTLEWDDGWWFLDFKDNCEH